LKAISEVVKPPFYVPVIKMENTGYVEQTIVLGGDGYMFYSYLFNKEVYIEPQN